MIDDAALAAARRRSAALAEQWRRGEAHRAMVTAFAGLPLDDAGPATRAARTLLAQDGWLSDLLSPLITALANDPLVEPPLRASRDALRIGALLHDCPAATLSLTTLSADALAVQPPARTVIVPGRVIVVHYLRGGGATLSVWHAERAGARFSAATAQPCRFVGAEPLRDGLVMRHDGRCRGQIIAGATRDVVTLTATIRAGSAPVMREYRIDTGALVRTATLDAAAARAQMLLTLLRVSGRADAAHCFEEASRHPAFFLRWAAMREWLALDAGAALPRLRGMAADDPHPEIRAAAVATLPQAEAIACPT